MANTLLVSCRGRRRPGLDTMLGLMQLFGTHLLMHMHPVGANSFWAGTANCYKLLELQATTQVDEM